MRHRGNRADPRSYAPCPGRRACDPSAPSFRSPHEPFAFDDPAHQDFTSLLLPAQRLRITTVPCRVRFIWFGVEKALAPEQRARVAERFDAAPQSLAATKKLVDTRHPAFRAVTAVRGRIDSYWRSMTLPFPEPGIRLIRLEDVEGFIRQMAAHSGELRDAAAELERHLDELKADAARRLGSLFDPADYPATLLGGFSVRWDFPNLEPPAHLAWLSPSAHQLEEFRVQTRYEEAVRHGRAGVPRRVREGGGPSLRADLGHQSPTGLPRVFRDAAVTDLGALIGRYRRFNLRSEARVDEMVTLVQRTLEGVTPRRLRDQPGLRRTVSAQLSWVRASLDTMQDDRAR